MTPEATRRVLALVGLGTRARNTVVGVEQVRIAAKKGKLALALVAGDASEHSRAKVLPLLAAHGIRVIDGLTASELGNAVGRDGTAAVGVTHAPLASGIRKAMQTDAAGVH